MSEIKPEDLAGIGDIPYGVKFDNGLALALIDTYIMRDGDRLSDELIRHICDEFTKVEIEPEPIQ